MEKREQYKLIIGEPARGRLERHECPSCGLPEKDWKRRVDWRCCSVECTKKFIKMDVIYGWPDLKKKAQERDGNKCVKCGDDRKEVEIEFKRKKVLNFKKWFSGREDPIYGFVMEKNVVSNFIGDHIIPIALGGSQWDINNVQTLCQACNKIKTAQDMKDIAIQRRKEKGA